MTDRSATTSRDFRFQTSDQAGAPQQNHQQSYGHYDAEGDTNAPSASEGPAHIQDPSLRFPDFGAQQQHGGAQGQFTGFGFSPSSQLGWDWTNSIDFSDFTNQYEPQGELVQELQNQTAPTNDFSIPLPITNTTPAFQSQQSQQHPPSTNPTPPAPQNPLSPPPRPPQQRPVVQTGMKRKVDSEPNSAVSQSASIATENPPKRHNKSRQSSDASITSPVITATAEARTASMTQVSAASLASESASQGNTDVARRKEQSKGTGPQGRVIDVSKPRKVVEAPGGPDVLPSGKVFPIQIGSELFRLSGASISSDGKHSNPIIALKYHRLRLLEHPHTFRISSASNCMQMGAALVT